MGAMLFLGVFLIGAGREGGTAEWTLGKGFLVLDHHDLDLPGGTDG